MMSTDPSWVDEIKMKLLEDFEIEDLGEASHCLGLEIKQDEKFIMLRQSRYIQDILEKYGMSNYNPTSTPSEVAAKQKDVVVEEIRLNDWPYRELIGTLMYLSIGTRPDISNTVSCLAQFTNEPAKHNWMAIKRLLRYLAGTREIGLVYRKNEKPLIGYSDANWGGCLVTRRSFTRYAFFLASAAVTWKSQRQYTVALSSTESEYVSLSEATKEALHLSRLLREIGLNDRSNVKIFVDNRSAQQ